MRIVVDGKDGAALAIIRTMSGLRMVLGPDLDFPISHDYALELLTGILAQEEEPPPPLPRNDMIGVGRGKKAAAFFAGKRERGECVRCEKPRVHDSAFCKKHKLTREHVMAAARARR